MSQSRAKSDAHELALNESLQPPRGRRLGTIGIAALGCASVLFALQGCSRTIPKRPVPQAEIGRALPKWYPEHPWTAHVGGRQFLHGKVVFDTAKSDLRPEALRVLAQLRDYLETNPDISRMRLEGHTDSRASEEYNQGLGARRAIAVANWLVDRGVDHMRLVAVSFGELHPIGPNKTAEGRQENRRAAFEIAELSGAWFMGKDPTNGGLVLEVKSKEEREREKLIGTVPTAKPKPFVPTGDIIEPMIIPKKFGSVGALAGGSADSSSTVADEPGEEPAEKPAEKPADSKK